ncbi:MAG: inorganic phosphate transporter [Gammaproteobacteria bacterium]|nr:inorganic phosphate transporter [Gammaproteobacteria bacterium]
MNSMLILIYITIAITLFFDFLNGFHDAANAIATVVSTRVLRPFQAVIWSAAFNFLAFFIFGLHVAATIGTGIVSVEVVNTVFILSALIAAIIWNLLTWYFGIPSSSSHALIGAMIGAAIVKAGFSKLVWSGIIKTVVSIFLSPILGLILGTIFMFISTRLFFHKSPQKVDTIFRRIQLVTSALLSVGHGGNDAQKSMGIIALLLFTGNLIGPSFHVPLWVVFSCYSAMALGTLFGGFRIVKTMGMKITKLNPVGGSSAELSGSMTLMLATGLGIPVSTTHTITGAIIGVGALQRLSAVRWGVARQIVVAWVITIPATAILAGIIHKIILVSLPLF